MWMMRTRSRGMPSISAIALAVGIDALRVRPHGQRAALERAPPRRTGRSSRASGRGACRSPRARARRLGGAPSSTTTPSSRNHLLQRRVELGLARQARRLRPARGARQRPHRLDRLELALGDDGEEAAVAHDAHHARHRLDGGGVHLHQPRRRARRPHDARMHHAGQAQVLHIGGAARDLGRDVDPRHRLAHDVGRRRCP